MDYINRILKVLVLTLSSTVLLHPVVAQTNNKSEKLFSEARNYYSADNYKKAIEICGQILKKDKEHTNTHLLLAEIYKDMDSTRLEIVHLTKAAKGSNNALVEFRLGEAFYKLGMY